MRLCHLRDLPRNGARGFDPHGEGQDSVFIVMCEGEPLAYADSCPHHGTPMAWRKDQYLNAAGDRIVCAAHGAHFEISTGICTLGPCLGDALTPIEIHVERGGEIHARLQNYKETSS
ncbi:nitrite reductase/ring-hydroxylating ferredoxin subunit [Acidovorax sp. 69]|uniref:Rieske (2Fe-2S) protein n=1 Tax=Acidovorax sp. 69 TaxID=2035202 RepID=UPI000C240219|nr:Rieske 2Fe-2S domain-containing protein [Acidovorax sp. 69]PJI95834.1 nitrite reductase/ring-hydroxylating ferredoxin subunit [Acidovorax sp. 69]